jgi:ligand-binding sensor domain-containing protein
MKTHSIYLSLLALITLFPFYAKGEKDYYFKHFSVENGLPQNTVSCILQDRQGFMWFGTKDGKNRHKMPPSPDSK